MVSLYLLAVLHDRVVVVGGSLVQSVDLVEGVLPTYKEERTQAKDGINIFSQL